MRSLASKLTLRFVAIGVLGAVLVALIVGYRTRRQFTAFLDAQSGTEVAGQLAAFYSARGGWDGVGDLIANTPELALRARFMTLLDADGAVVFQTPGRPEVELPAAGDNSTEVVSGGQTVGTLLLVSAETVRNPATPPPPEALFLREVTLATALSALLAGLLALAAGYWLARGLTHPLRALTAASQEMAAGNLGAQVAVQSEDEIGRLATAFNAMSRDLATASERRKRLTADIAHDLRTPLSILRGYLEGLKDGDLDGDPRLYGIMFEEVALLEHLVGDLRTLSLADAGELTLNRRAIDVRALLERSALAYVMQADAQGIDLRIDAADDLPPLHADAERLTQVLNNLISNALHHIETGEIVLAAARVGERLHISVRDTGSGITADDLPHVFERFYRGDRSRTRAGGTSGLGLAIARALVEAHGGTISAESSTSTGSTFLITLPNSPHAEAAG